MINPEQIYEQVKNHEWKEEITSHGTKEILPLVFEGKCTYMPEKNIVIVFYPGYPMREGRAHVDVFLKKPGEIIGEQIAMYCSFEKWYKYSHYKGINEPIPESPFETFIPVAEMDNTMAYMNEEGMIEVFTEDGAVEWGRDMIDVCREALENGKTAAFMVGYVELWDFPTAKEMLAEKKMTEDFRSVIALYKDYETYIRLHYPRWEDRPDNGPLPAWLKEEEKTSTGFRFIRRDNPTRGGKL